MSTLRVNTIQDATGSGTPAINGLAKAWVNFNGTGTVAIRASMNVSSITDRGTGLYTVNLSSAVTDSNYGIGALCNEDASTAGGYNRYITGFPASSSGFYLNTCVDNVTSTTLTDVGFISAAIFR